MLLINLLIQQYFFLSVVLKIAHNISVLSIF